MITGVFIRAWRSDAEAVHARQHDVEQDDVQAGVEPELERTVAVVSQLHGMPLSLECPAEQVGSIRSIFRY
jgi:hypothetical protein